MKRRELITLGITTTTIMEGVGEQVVDVWSMKMWSMSGGGQRRVQSPKLIDVQVSLGNQIDTTQANVRDTFRISCSAVKDSPRKEIIIWSPDTERRLEHLWNNPSHKKAISPLFRIHIPTINI